NQTTHGIHQHEGCRFTTSKNVIAYRNFLARERSYPFIKTLIVTADQRYVSVLRKGNRSGVIKRSPLRAQQNNGRIGRAFDRFKRGEERLRLQHHSRTATIWSVIDFAPTVRAKLIRTVCSHSQLLSLDSPSDDTCAAIGVYHVREKRYDMECKHRFLNCR